MDRYTAICFWKFGPQCPTSPLLPPRKDPLEDLILQLVYRPDPTTSSCDVGDPDPPPGQAAKNKNIESGDDQYEKINLHSMTFIGCLACYLAGTCAWLQPVFQEPGSSR
ncbi:hypothetical protein F511_46366 [Dorcoceras hygrometricum]|uniref:Uncharacterized protein n=1 Tax=Dorcoceras hygrometricum TaxID=472368 RepID=A0A2Z6ZTQ3_9LAMI|nr:hypothetical protein F511_46366 [Dorcoceras hygrometricum]